MLHIVHCISGLQRGGAETLLCTLIRELPQFRHTVIFVHDGPIRKEIEALGISCIHIFDVKKLKTLTKPDLLHCVLWMATTIGPLIGKLFKIPTICALHSPIHNLSAFRKIVGKLTARYAKKTVAVSQGVAESARTFWNILPAQLVTIPNGIQIVSVVKRTPDNVCIIGTVGRLVPLKNHALLIETFAQLIPQYPYLRLIIVGSGPEEKNLRTKISQLNLDNVVTLAVGKKAHEYLGFFDIFVQPSAYEGLSLALLEALAAQLPVIVTGKNSVHEVVEHEKSGIVIEPTEKSLAQGLRLLIKNPALRRKIAQRGFERVKKDFSLPAMVEKYALVFTLQGQCSYTARNSQKQA